MKFTVLNLALLVLALSNQIVVAEVDSPAGAEERVAQLRDRLRLSDEQADLIAPVLQESLAKQKTIMARYGIDLDNPGSNTKRPGFRQLRAMRAEVEDVRTGTLASLEDILTPEQIDEFKLIQEEQRAEMRKRIRSRASAG